MAIMWYAKDGMRPHAQRGPDTDVSLAEIHAIFGSERLHFAGAEAPSINPGAPSPSEKNVVLEIGETDGFSELLPRAGFYLLVDVRPPDAGSRLHAHRAAT